MSEIYNIYCDESCHIENDRQPIMVLGAVWCPAARAAEVSMRLREIKVRHAVLSPEDLREPRSRQFELKWTKVSPAKLDLYRDWLDYFFDDDDLHFRAVVIDKAILDHAAWSQTHDDWYYKMLFRLLEPLIDPEQRYRIYLDIKDTRSERKRAKLQEVLRKANYDFDGKVVALVQQIRSHESELLQLADLLIGAVAFHNRLRRAEVQPVASAPSAAKLALVQRIRERSRKSLERSTWLRESKLNLFHWSPKESQP